MFCLGFQSRPCRWAQKGVQWDDTFQHSSGHSVLQKGLLQQQLLLQLCQSAVFLSENFHTTLLYGILAHVESAGAAGKLTARSLHYHDSLCPCSASTGDELWHEWKCVLGVTTGGCFLFCVSRLLTTISVSCRQMKKQLKFTAAVIWTGLVQTKCKKPFLDSSITDLCSCCYYY